MKKLEQLEGSERISVGYFTYQGLWIHLNDAKKLADCWGVRSLLRALLDDELPKADNTKLDVSDELQIII
jgi:hypothetical protein